MPAYASTTTSLTPVSKKLAATGLAIFVGTINVTNYNTVLAEITAITGKFRSAPNVVITGQTSLGYGATWDRTAKSVKCWKTTTVGLANIELANDVNAGIVEFIAVGPAP